MTEKITNEKMEKAFEFFCIVLLGILFFCGMLIFGGAKTQKAPSVKHFVEDFRVNHYQYPSRYGPKPGELMTFKINGETYRGRVYPSFVDLWQKNDTIYAVRMGPFVFDVLEDVWLCPTEEMPFNYMRACISLEAGMNNPRDRLKLTYPEGIAQ